MSSGLVRTVFEGWDLEVSNKTEPRARDVDIATRAGLAVPATIRRVIEKNQEELAAHGDIRVIALSAKTSGGRPGREYWLNEDQAAALIALMRTPKARELRIAIVRVFGAWRRGLLTPPPLAIEVHSARVGDNALFRDDMAAWCTMTSRALGVSVGRVHGAVRRQFLVAGVYLVPIALWPLVREFLQALSTRRLLLPGSSRPNLRLVRSAISTQLQLPLSP